MHNPANYALTCTLINQRQAEARQAYRQSNRSGSRILPELAALAALVLAAYAVR